MKEWWSGAHSIFENGSERVHGVNFDGIQFGFSNSDFSCQNDTVKKWLSKIWRFLAQIAIVVFVFMIPIDRRDPNWFFEAMVATFGGFFNVDLRPSILQKWRLANSCLAPRALNGLRVSQRIQILWYFLSMKDILALLHLFTLESVIFFWKKSCRLPVWRNR